MKRAVLALVMAACTDPKGFATLSDTNLSFTPAETELERFPAQCGVDNAPYTDDDVFSLTMLGPPATANTATQINVTFHRTLPLHQSLPVDLGAFEVVGDPHAGRFGQNGTLPLQGNSFLWAQGVDPNELDAQALDNVVVRIDQVPNADGEHATLTIRMHFVDGGIYDFQISVPATTPFTGCPVG